jgi:hypothetical protein
MTTPFEPFPLDLDDDEGDDDRPTVPSAPPALDPAENRDPALHEA